jgi:hypothetical protein
MTVAVVAPLAFVRLVIETFDFEAIRLHESPLTTEYVAPEQAGFEGPTAFAIWVMGTMPVRNITMAKSQRPREDATCAPLPLCCSDTGGIRSSLLDRYRPT